MKDTIISIWVFNGEDSRFSSGVFSDKQIAEEWIKKNNLTGVLTLYPLNEGIYDWAIKNDFFLPAKEKETTPNFIGAFSSAGQEHYHYINGNIDERGIKEK